MKKSIVIAFALAAVLVPAALATAPAQNPAQYCKAHPELIGSGQGKLYATFSHCVRKQTAAADVNIVNAAKTCMAQKDDANFAASHDGKTFDQFYASNDSKSNANVGGNGNALGKCVSAITSAKTGEQQNAQLNAAKKCRTTQNAANIGVGKTWRNFGACVKAQTKPT